MRAEPLAQAGARHGVPLVADAPGVEPQGPRRTGLATQRRHFRRNETTLAVIGEEAALREEPFARRLALARGPLHGFQGIEGLVGQRGQRADIEVAAAIVLERRE